MEQRSNDIVDYIFFGPQRFGYQTPTEQWSNPVKARQMAKETEEVVYKSMCISCFTCCCFCYGCCGLCFCECCDKILNKNMENLQNLQPRFFILYCDLPTSRLEAEAIASQSQGSELYDYEKIENEITTTKNPLNRMVANCTGIGSIIVWLCCHGYQGQHFLAHSNSLQSPKVKVVVVNTCHPQSTQKSLFIQKPVITYHYYDDPVSDLEAMISAFLLFRALISFDEQTTQLFKINEQRLFSTLLAKLELCKEQNLTPEIIRGPVGEASTTNAVPNTLYKRPIGIFYGGFDGSRDVSSMDSGSVTLIPENAPDESVPLIHHKQRKDFPSWYDAPDFNITAPKIKNQQVVVEASQQVLTILDRVMNNDYEVIINELGFLEFKFDDHVFKSPIRKVQGKIVNTKIEVFKEGKIEYL